MDTMTNARCSLTLTNTLQLHQSILPPRCMTTSPVLQYQASIQGGLVNLVTQSPDINKQPNNVNTHHSWTLPRLLLANVRSLRFITDELTVVLQTNSIDVCCITESWLNNEIPTEAVDIEGYVCYRRDRQDGRQGGGVVCYVRDDQPFCLLKPADDDEVESLWLLYRQPRMPRAMSHILVGVVYHPPSAVSHVTTTNIVDNVDAVVRQHPNVGTLIVGDFNKMKDKPLRDLSLKQVVKVATRKSATLDKIYTNIGEWYKQPRNVPSIANSDHTAVILLPIDGGIQTAGQRTTVTVRSNDRNCKSQLARHLAAFDWSELYEMMSTESMATYFYSVTTSLLDHYLPLRVVNRYSTDKPWVTDEFRRLIRQRQYAWTNNNMADYHRFRNAVNRLSKKLRKHFYENKVKGLRSCESANWWRQTKRLTGQISKPDLAGLANNLTGGDMGELARRINDSLINVSADLTRLSSADVYYNTEAEHEMIPDECEYTITPDVVFHRLERINIRKAPGPDNLPNWFLRDFAFALSEPLCCIFNSSLLEGVVPTVWKQANIVAIPKTKPPKSIEQDLRPISLTPTLSKILESLIGRWMLEKIGDKFDRKQFGALKGRSTTHALVDIMHQWHKAIDDRQSVRVIFVDYAKAFDHVDHPTVMKKLAAIGVPPIILRWLHSFLMDRQQRVMINGAFSDWASPNGSMPQGTWLGPYVFLTLINDLTSMMELHKFVDDCTLSEIVSKHDISTMQYEIDDLNSWSQSNHMNINTKKTKEMLLGSIGKNPPPAVQLAGLPIDHVHSYKLLGLHITDTLKWNEHVSSICTKAATRLHFLKVLKRAAMSTDDLTYYYQSVVRPVTEYACAVWNSSLTKGQTKQLESIQRRAVKIIFGNDASEVSHALDTLPSLAERRHELTKQFFTSILAPTSCLHHLLPDKRETDVISRLRSAKQYSPPFARTERYKKSTIVYALNNYQ